MIKSVLVRNLLQSQADDLYARALEFNAEANAIVKELADDGTTDATTEEKPPRTGQEAINRINKTAAANNGTAAPLSKPRKKRRYKLSKATRAKMSISAQAREAKKRKAG